MPDGWRFDLVVKHWCLNQSSYSTLGPVSAWMGDRLRAGKLSQYVTSHPGQLNLAIRPWVGTMSTSLGWGGNCKSGDNSGLPIYGLNAAVV